MLYEKYKQKMLKIKDALKFVVRHRVLFILVALVIFSSATGLCVAKGSIISEGKCDKEIVYGETISFRASAFISDVYYEYASARSNDWVTEFPKDVGEFKVRASARGAFGSVKSGKEHKFTILPKPITLNSASEFQYGDLPALTSEGLCYGDTVTEAEFSYNGDFIYSSSIITPKIESIVIRSRSGKRVTDCYQITANSATNVRVLKRAITVKTGSGEKEYDGTALQNTEYEITSGSLATGDEITVSNIASLKDAGSMENRFDITVNSPQFGDVTDKYYQITYDSGILKVNKRVLKITTQSASKEYDGYDMVCPEYSITEGSLVDNQYINLTDCITVCDAGEYSNVLSLDIFEGIESVTKNYQVEYTYGTLTVEKRKIEVQTGSNTFVYNGEGQSEKHYEIISQKQIADNDAHMLKNNEAPEFLDVGSYTNNLEIDVTRGGVSCIENYEITYEYGTVTLLKRDVRFISDSITDVYDGEELFCKDYICYNLVEGHYADVVEYSKLINVGKVVNEHSYVIRDGLGNDVSENYEISANYGTITVTQRRILLKPRDKNVVYNGRVNVATEVELITKGRYLDLVSGHSAQATFKEGESYGIKYVGEISTEIQSVVISSASGDETSNYLIEFQSGKIEVVKRPIGIKPADYKKIYDDEPINVSNVTVEQYSIGATEEGLVAGDKIAEFTIRPISGRDVSEYTSYLVDGSIEIYAGSKKVTFCYDLSLQSGIANIEKRPITVRAKPVEKVYDGQAVQTEIVMGGGEYWLVKDHYISYFELSDSCVNANVYNVTVLTDSVVIESLSEGEKTYNYDIKSDVSEIVVKQREITVKPKDAQKEYDGTPLFATEAEIVGSSTVLSNHYFEYLSNTSVNSITNVGEIDSILNEKSIKITDGIEDLTANYVIKAATGKLTVTQKIIRIKPRDESKPYDGTPLTGSVAEVVSGFDEIFEGNISHVKVLIRTDGSITIPGTVTNNITEYKIITVNEGYNGTDDLWNSEFATDLTANYVVECEVGYLTVTERELIIKARDKSKIYDGTPLTWPRYEIDIKTPLVENERIIDAELKIEGSITDVSTVPVPNVIVAASLRIVNASDQDVTEYYSITLQDGELTIIPRKLTIKTFTKSWEYDGEEHSSPFYNESAEYGNDLLEGHEFKVTYYPTITEVGSIPNALQLGVFEGERDVSHNYELRYINGTLTVTGRKITIKTASNSWVYDGKVHYDEGFSITEGTLLDNHKATVIAYTEILDVGEEKNYLGIDILNENGLSKLRNYEITWDIGTLTVTKLEITIKTATNSWIYDGQYKSDKSFEILSKNGVVEGETIGVTEFTQILNVGTVDNQLTFVVKRGDKNTTSNYELKIELGTLTVLPIELIVKPKDQTFYYTETEYPLGACEIVNIESLPADYKLYATVNPATVIDLGEYVVSIEQGTVVIYYEEFDVTANFDIIGYETGIVKVVEIVKDGGLNEDGDIRGPNVGEGEPDGGDGTGMPALRVFSDVTTSIYMRYMSFGDYNGQSFAQASEYDKLIDEIYGANYLSGIALSRLNTLESEVKIESYTNNYLLPSYLAMGNFNYNIQTSDVKYVGNIANVYQLKHYLYEFDGDTDSLKGANLGKYSQFEEAYRKYVYQTYTSVPASTSEYLKTVIKEKGFTLRDPKVIKKVASYVSTAATYNLAYDKALDLESDILVAFLRDYKEGICQHYALAATMLYRELGIPARYVIGYYANATAGKWSLVSPLEAHAWVEVYVNGVGWLVVDATGSSDRPGNGGGGNGGGNDGGGSDGGGSVDNQKIDIEIELADRIECISDYSLLDASEEGTVSYKVKGLSSKYKIELDLFGRIEGVGSALVSLTSFTVYNADGVDVTKKFNATCNVATLRIYQSKLTIKTPSAEKFYDGEYLYDINYEILSGELRDGDIIVIDNFSQILKPATVENVLDIKITDAETQTQDLTDNYLIKFENGTLKITSVQIQVETGSAEKYYDGTPLENGEYKYEIKNGELGDGHTLSIDVIGSITNPGTAINDTIVKVFDENGEEVTDIYEIAVDFGTLTVKEPIEVTLKPKDMIEPYTGEPLVATEIEGFEEFLALGYKLVDVEIIGEQIELGESESEIVNYLILDPDGKEITDNRFSVTLEKGLLRVTKTQVVIMLYSVSKIYDGTPLSYYEDDYYLVKKPSGVENLYIKLGGEITGVGSLTYDEISAASEYRFYDYYGYDVTDNFYLKIEGEPLTVLPTDIEVTSISVTKIFDEQPLSNPTAWVSKGSLVKGHSIYILVEASLMYISEIPNRIVDVIILDENGHDVTEYYNVTKNEGTLKIVSG